MTKFMFLKYRALKDYHRFIILNYISNIQKSCVNLLLVLLCAVYVVVGERVILVFFLVLYQNTCDF